MKKFIVILFLLFAFFCDIYARHIYYFGSGSTNGNGTIEQPFTKLEILSQLSLQADDVVFFHGGDTISGQVVISNIRGDEKHPVMLTSYGGGKCIINGGDKEAFVIMDSKNFHVLNLAFIGLGRKTGNTTDGIKLVNCSHAIVKDIDVSGFQKSGLIIFDSEDMEMNNVYAYDNGFAGILVEGTYKKRLSNNIHIINCRADNNPGDPTALDNHSGNGILVGNCKNVLIEYCTATNNGWDMPRVGNGPVGIWAYEADSVTIQYCISYRNKTAAGAADGGGFDLDGGVTNSVIQYCLSYENYGSGYGIYQYYSASNWYNNTVRFCISINDGNVTKEAGAMLIWNGWNGDSTFEKFYAYNNFFYNDTKYVFGFAPQSQHRQFSFFNNVFVASDTSNIYNGIDSSTNDIFLGNVWMRKNGGFMQNGFTDLQQWSAAMGYEQHDGKLSATSFQHDLFSVTQPVDITDPRQLKTNKLLLSLCNDSLRKKGIDIRKLFAIDVGKTDFFGNAVSSAAASSPGICVIQ